MTKVKAVIFDMDGLIFATEKLYYQSNQATADEIGLPFNYTFYEKYIGASDKDFFGALHEEHQNPSLVDQFIKKSKEDIHHTLLTTSLPKQKGLMTLLDYLQSKDIEMVVASSTEREIVNIMIGNADISNYFKAVVGGDEVENSKPDPAIFLKALGYTSAEKEEAVVLEDSLNGVRAAHAAGIPVLMVPDLLKPNQEAKEKATDIVSDLTKVIDYIKIAEKKD
ncbi:HAD family hydrolase [Marinilactibacillus kalidii]|uniref:HAD family hydrolase n=1 Tax=Marinilactibacillus kalidii TaxID=2820274 RepID=UPI001ABE9A1A|nr:HAD family phosphatase [Marinilactibacillus kalidii]